MISSAAAPLLAGFALTILLLILPTTVGTADVKFARWPEPVAVLLTASATLLIHAVQAGAHARSTHATPGDLEAWLGPLMKPEAIKNFRREMQSETVKWISRTRRLYQGGVLLLLTAIAIVLVPTAGQPVSAWRVAAITVAAASPVIEFIWVVRNARITRRVG